MTDAQLNWVQSVSNKTLIEAFNLPPNFTFDDGGYEYIEHVLFSAMETEHREYLMLKFK